MSAHTCALTLSIDWEDFGQLLARDRFKVERVPLADIDRQTAAILQLLDDTSQKATFFVLGMLAKHKKSLVREISDAGHEIAIHGSSHRRLDQLTRGQIKTDIGDALHLVEDLCGQKVRGYRAPCFSVGRRNLYVLDILAELGLLYDSSVFPMRLPKYGIDGFCPTDALYRLPEGGELVELPLTVYRWAGRNWPVSGGGYFRVLPKSVIASVYRAVAASSDQAKMIYMHPYEFDIRALDPSSNFPPGESLAIPRSIFLRLRWNVRRKSIIRSIRMLLREHTFITCQQRATYVQSTTKRPRLLE